MHQRFTVQPTESSQGRGALWPTDGLTTTSPPPIIPPPPAPSGVHCDASRVLCTPRGGDAPRQIALGARYWVSRSVDVTAGSGWRGAGVAA